MIDIERALTDSGFKIRAKYAGQSLLPLAKNSPRALYLAQRG